MKRKELRVERKYFLINLNSELSRESHEFKLVVHQSVWGFKNNIHKNPLQNFSKKIRLENFSKNPLEIFFEILKLNF